jgi:hypothetical protein
MSWCAMVRACLEVVYAAIDDVDSDLRRAFKSIDGNI